MGRHRTNEQSKILIEFMQRHKDIATCSVKREDRENTEILWQSLTKELNAKGPPVKDSHEWRKAWADWKKACRKKLEQPGNGNSISDYERIICELCGFTEITLNEYESDENSGGSTTSSDTPLKIKTVHNATSYTDPLKQENEESLETARSDVQLPITVVRVDNRGRHRSPEQSTILLDFMQLHREMARGNFKEMDNKKARMLWKQLADELNVWGPPYRSPTAWRKGWADWKMSCRKKLAQNEGNVDERRSLTRQEQSIIDLCGLKAAYEEETNSWEDEASNSSSITSNTQIKMTKEVVDKSLTNEQNMCKKRKLKEESPIEFNDDESFIAEHLLESPVVQDEPRAATPPLTNIERSLADVRAGVATIQTSLQELCRLMAEQNQELRRFVSDTRRHHFVVEKELNERKRERMK